VLALVGLLGALLVGCAAGTATAPATSAAASASASSAAGAASASSAAGAASASSAAGAVGSGAGASARADAPGCPVPSPGTPGAQASHLPLRSLCALPPQAAQVWNTIQSGGRPTYSRDGIVFNNAERILPAHDRGYYHEYTVPTPGSRDRGARRLVTGQADEVYYTGDHYATFFVVDPTAKGRG